MYKFIGCLGFILSSIFSGQAVADRVDEINKAPPVEFCNVVTNQFYHGMVGRMTGDERKIADPVGAPDGAMLVEDWDNATKQEKEFVAKHVFAGWDLMNDLIAKEGFIHLDSLAYQFHTECVIEREKAMKQSKSEHMTKDRNYLKKQYERMRGQFKGRISGFQPQDMGSSPLTPPQPLRLRRHSEASLQRAGKGIDKSVAGWGDRQQRRDKLIPTNFREPFMNALIDGDK